MAKRALKKKRMKKDEVLEICRFLLAHERFEKNARSYILASASSCTVLASSRKAGEYSYTEERIRSRAETFGCSDAPLSFEHIEHNAADMIPLFRTNGAVRELPRWKEHHPNITVALAHSVLVRHGLYRSFTLHLSEDISRKCLIQGKAAGEYLRRRIRDRFRLEPVLRGYQPEIFWIMERSNNRRMASGDKLLHVHGALSIPSRDAQVLTAIESALRKAGGRDYVSGKPNDQLHLSDTSPFLPGKDRDGDGEVGWVDYSLPSLRVNTKPARSFMVSRGLTRASKALYNAYRDGVSSIKTNHEYVSAITALHDWAMETWEDKAAAGGMPGHVDIPSDIDAFREIVELLNLEGMDFVKNELKSDIALLKETVFNLQDLAHANIGRPILKQTSQNTLPGNAKS